LIANKNFKYKAIDELIYQHFLLLASLVLCCCRKLIHPYQPLKSKQMTSHQLHSKAAELGVSPQIISCAVNILSQNRNLVNAIDNSVEMDDYIYRAILRQAFDKRMAEAERDFYSYDEAKQRAAERDLKILEREELTSDAFYRAVLPLMVKTLQHEPIRRLHAEEASTIVMQLADCKRRFRATSLTEVIVKKCSIEIESFQTAKLFNVTNACVDICTGIFSLHY
jgi:hypothetical protein